MKRKTVVFRTAANRDVREAASYYADTADADTALRFARAINDATNAIANGPKLGSPRYAELAHLPGLRHRSLQRFPQLVFYLERDDIIQVIRVLHGARDIPATLSAAASEE